MSKICCGGFELGEGLELDGKVLKVSGGESLPEVTAEDNGDVLTVVGGAWAKAAPSGSGVVVKAEVDLSYNRDDELEYDVISVNKNAAEVINAYEDGANVVFNIALISDDFVKFVGVIPMSLTVDDMGEKGKGAYIKLNTLLDVADYEETRSVMLIGWGNDWQIDVF